MEGSFCLTAAGALAPTLLNARTRPDAVLYVGAQPAIAMLSRVIAATLRVPYFVNINDLAAQAAADLGLVGSGWVQNALERFEFAAYGSAAGASVLCRSFADTLIAHGYPHDRIRLIRSPIDVDRVRPLPPKSEYRDTLGVPRDAFVVLFAGSMGLKQGLENVVEAAHCLRESSGLVWVLAGDGEMRQSVEALVENLALPNHVRFLPFQPEDKVASMLAAADVLLLNQVGSVKDAVIPSKLLTYMAAGRPVLAAVNASSQGAEILQEADGGLLVAPDDPGALARGVEMLRKLSPHVLAAMGARNRAYAEEHFDQRKILAELESFLFARLSSRDSTAARRP
jgi:colanic acid biosynthesis glycosyl transferase WcaI